MAKLVRKKTAQYKKVKGAINRLDKTTLKVGFFDSAKYPDGTPVAYGASIQEFGVPEKGIPSRSFMRTTIEEKKTEWAELMKEGASAIVSGGESVKSVLEKMGSLAAGQVGEKIASIQSPALAPATIKARQRSLANGKAVGNLTKPLVSTKVLIQSPTHLVE